MNAERLLGLGLGRVDVSKLYPLFLEEIVGTLALLSVRGIRYVATSGFRSTEEQDAIYAIGRTLPGKIKTKVRGGRSYHNWGLALDFARDRLPATPSLEPSWAEADMTPLAAAAEGSGQLQAGLYFKDFVDGPHIQLRLPLTVTLEDFQGLSVAEAWRKLDGFYGRVSKG